MQNRTKFLIIWLALALGLVFSHFGSLFLERHSEYGDFAANALQIRNAKFFEELYGNYSRWRFYHPGPSFFYAYAFGEYLFYDFLGLVPSAYNAHVIIGILIQTGFFVWTLSILQRHLSHSLLVPVLLLFGALHFGAVNHYMPYSAFQSIWPPHVLLFPFLCLLVACVAIASGSTRDILPAVIAGGMLVHGHVAQPLFVLPFFTIACAALLITSRLKGERIHDKLRAHRRQLIVCGVLLAIFFLPLALDALKGTNSNLHAIYLHLQRTADHKSFSQSIAYLGTFFCYLGNPETIFASDGKPAWGFLIDRWYFTVPWALILVCVAGGVLAIFRGNNLFLKWLCVYFALGVALTIYWGVRQSGEMYNFNSHFNFGLLFLAIIILVLAILSRIPEPKSWVVVGSLCVATLSLYTGLVCGWRLHRSTFSALNGTQFDEVATALKREPASTRYLKFRGNDWAWATGVAIALRRLGSDFRVAPEWAYMFGSRHELIFAETERANVLAVWTVRPPGQTDAGFQLKGGPFVSTTNSLLPLSPDGGEITFAGPDVNAENYLLTGWDVSTGSFSWSSGKFGLIRFQPEPTISDVNVTVDLLPAGYLAKPQRVMISFNGGVQKSYEVSDQQTLEFQIPSMIWNQDDKAQLVFQFPDAKSPLAAGASDDYRELSCGFTRIRFQQVDATKP